MKRKIIVSFVIALLVLTVFGAATISAAPSSTSAAPNKTPKNPYNVSIGQNTMWTGAQCNVHQAGTWGTIGSATVAQSSKGSTITTTATSPYEPTSGSGGSNSFGRRRIQHHRHIHPSTMASSLV